MTSIKPTSTARGGPCDEGGAHKWIRPKGTSACGCLWKVLCCPCYLMCGLLMSNGAAGASQYQFKGEEEGEVGQEICEKCGLTPSEATALSDVQYNEQHGIRTSKGAMYFSNAMALPPSPSPSHPPHSNHSPNTLHSSHSINRQHQQQQQHLSPSSHPPSLNLNRTSGVPQVGETRQDQAVGNWLATLPSNNNST